MVHHGATQRQRSIVWTLLCVATEVIHIPGDNNVRCDRLPRRGMKGLDVSMKQEMAEMGLGGVTLVEMNGCESVTEILRLCDPRVVLGTESDFVAISSFLALHPPRHTTHSYNYHSVQDLTESVPNSPLPAPFFSFPKILGWLDSSPKTHNTLSELTEILTQLSWHVTE